MSKLDLQTDLLFSTEAQRVEAKKERVDALPVEDLHEFPNHPFKVRDDEAMEMLVNSICENGLLHPILVRERKEGGYEIVAGHRRKRACELAGMTHVDCLIKEMSDEEAAIVMVDSNIQRENVLPSEKAFAYRMKNDAIKTRGKRTPLAVNQNSHGANRKTYEVIRVDGDSKDTIFRYIRLTELVPSLLDMVDEGKLPFIPAVSLSYLSKEHQNCVNSLIAEYRVSVSKAQAKQLQERAKEKTLTEDAIKCILCIKKPKKETYTIQADRIDAYFPPECKSKEEREKYVISALEYYRQRETREEQ